MAFTEDRWYMTVRNEDDSETKVPSPRHGTGLRWRVRYLTPEGAEKSKSFDRKPDAERFRIRVEAELLNGTYMDPKAGRITLRRYAEQWLEAQTFDEVSRESTEFRVAHILAGLGGKRLDELAATPSVVQAWLRNLDLADSTKRACLSTLSTIFAAAIDDGKAGRNPCKARSVKAPSIPQPKVVPLEAAQLAALREALPARCRAMIDAGASCGLRQGEIFGLAKDDIDFLRHTVHVRRQVKIVRGKLTFSLPKGRKTRDVPLSEPASLALAEHIRLFPPATVKLPWHGPGHRGKDETCSLLFTTPQARQALRRHRFNSNTWKPALRKAAIPDTRENGMHVLRHSYASLLLSLGLDIKTLSECLGHSNAAFTLKVYAHLMPGSDDRVRALLNKAALGPVTARERSG